MGNISVTTKRLVFNRNGQALVEYTLVVLLVTFVFWLGIRDTDFGQGLQTAWTGVTGSISPTTDNGAGGIGGGSSAGAGSNVGGSSGGNSAGGSGSGSGDTAGGSTTGVTGGGAGAGNSGGGFGGGSSAGSGSNIGGSSGGSSASGSTGGSSVGSSGSSGAGASGGAGGGSGSSGAGGSGSGSGGGTGGGSGSGSGMASASASNGVSADDAAKDSRAVAGFASRSTKDEKIGFGAASKNVRVGDSSSGGNSSGSGGIFQLGFWLSLLTAALLLTIPALIWAVVKSVRSQEESQNDEVVYKNLNVVQIYGRIIKKS